MAPKDLEETMESYRNKQLLSIVLYFSYSKLFSSSTINLKGKIVLSLTGNPLIKVKFLETRKWPWFYETQSVEIASQKWSQLFHQILEISVNLSYYLSYTSSLDESISTCRFAKSVSLVKNTVSKNERTDPALIIAKLKK